MLAIVLTPSFQTWAVRRFLEARPDWHTSVGSVAASFGSVRLTQLRYTPPGLVLDVPAIEVTVPLLRLWRDEQLSLSRVVASGWTLSLATLAPVFDPGQGPAVTASSGPAVVGSVSARAHSGARPRSGPAALAGFTGLLGPIAFPLDVSLDHGEFVGECVLPASFGRVNIAVSGGDLGVGRVGTFAIVLTAALADPAVAGVDVRGTVQVAMATPRAISEVTARLSTVATGPRLASDLSLTLTATAARAGDVENYALGVARLEESRLSAQATFNCRDHTIAGRWKIATGDADFQAFSRGAVWPSFALQGAGGFSGEATFDGVRAQGRLEGKVNRLQAFAPAWAALGEVTLGLDFALAARPGTIEFERLAATVAAGSAQVHARALQPVTFFAETSRWLGRDSAQDALTGSFQELPLAWANSFFPSGALASGSARGEWSAALQAGGGKLRSLGPILINSVVLAREGHPLCRSAELAFNLTGDLQPEGWQVALNGLTWHHAAEEVLRCDARVGQLAGPGQPIKATGQGTVALAPLSDEPFGAGALRLAAGLAAVDFAASLGTGQAWQMNYALTELAASIEGAKQRLPSLAGTLRLDFLENGSTELNFPVGIEFAGRRSDLTLAGTLSPPKDHFRTVAAVLSSSQLALADLQLLAAALSPSSPKNPQVSSSMTPPWHGLEGAVQLQLKKIIGPASTDISNVTGVLKIAAGTVRLENLQAALGDQGRGNLTGTLNYEPSAAAPYVLAVEVAVKAFDVGPFFRENGDKALATIDGKFDGSSRFVARGAGLWAWPVGIMGECQLTSRGGVFRGFPLAGPKATAYPPKRPGAFGAAVSAFGGLIGTKDATVPASKGEAVAEFSQGLERIAYDQLNVVLAQGTAVTTLQEFTLISPEMRLSGRGTLSRQSGTPFFDEPLAMEFKLRVRGRSAELLKFAGVLDSEPDKYGYLAATIPLRISGSLARPDATEVASRLAALALEKSRVGEKAVEVFNKVFGK